MSKYDALHKDIYSVFDTVEWTSEGIVAIPANIASPESAEFIRLNIVTGGIGVNRLSVSGQLIVDIYVEAGAGEARATQIADTLDRYLANKVIKTTALGTTQFAASTLTSNGIDSVNKSLYRYMYSLPVNFFGV